MHFDLFDGRPGWAMRNIDIDTNADTHKREERKRKEKYFIIAAVALRHIVLYVVL